MERLNPPPLPPTAGQSQVVVTGNLVYLSGQVALDSSGELIGGGDFAAQLRQVLANVDAALRAAGAAPGDVVKLTIYVVDLDPVAHGPALGEQLNDLSRYGHPAATLLSVAGLARPDFLVEIEAVAELA